MERQRRPHNQLKNAMREYLSTLSGGHASIAEIKQFVEPTLGVVPESSYRSALQDERYFERVARGCSASVSDQIEMSVVPGMLQDMFLPTSVPELVAFAVALGADQVGDLAPRSALIQEADSAPTECEVDWIKNLIRAGEDPLGDAYCAIRSPQERRPLGQTYTLARSSSRWLSGRVIGYARASR